MQILRLHIENFGKLHDLDLELQEGLQVIRRDNGWGKSTLAAFVKAMFYGLPYTTRRALQENDRKRYFPWQGGAFGGSLEFEAEGRRYRVERFFGVKDKEDTFDLYDLQTGLMSLDYSSRLGEELFGVDRNAYGRSCFLGQQDFTVSVNDSLSARLTKAEEDTGDMGNYERGVSSLEEQMKYYRKTGGRGQIGKLEEERRIIRSELLVRCREYEDEMEELNFTLTSREQLLEKAAARIKDTERQIREAQEYQQIEAKRAQYELLKGQAEEKQKELKETADALAEYTGTPFKEEELDRCRERIYQLDGLRQREEGAARQVREAVSRQGDVEDEKNALSSPGIFFVILAGLAVALGVFCLFRGKLIAGGASLCLGMVFFFLGYQKSRRYQEKLEQLELRIQESGRSVREAEHILQDMQKKQDALEKKIDDFLGIPKGTGAEEMERLWKEERKRSREHRELQQRYEMLRAEAGRSRELWFQYGESIPEEERKRLTAPRESEPDVRILRKNLEEQKARKEQIRKEQEEIRYRLKGLQEKVEQIPKLQEQEAELSERLEEAVREHGILEQTIQYLKKAREQFSSHYLKELRERLEYYLAKLEPGRETGISLDVSLQMKVQETGAYRSLETQSAGQQDLLYLAERLAVIDVLYKGEQPFLILDDPFTNLDATRQRRAFDLLEHISEKRQILCFTCHGE